jgi:hypothetical protein
MKISNARQAVSYLLEPFDFSKPLSPEVKQEIYELLTGKTLVGKMDKSKLESARMRFSTTKKAIEKEAQFSLARLGIQVNPEKPPNFGMASVLAGAGRRKNEIQPPLPLE